MKNSGIAEIKNPLIDDSCKPDFKVYWKDPNMNKEGDCKIFTYGKGFQMAISVFTLLYPNHQILMVENI